jgi:sodium-dependent phosphate cotransporter
LLVYLNQVFSIGLAEELLSNSAAPLIGLFIGILATSLIQSSSTTTPLVVGMVAVGTFGDDPILAVSAANPYIMGANIGTSVTNTIVSLGHIVNKNEFKRAADHTTNIAEDVIYLVDGDITKYGIGKL